MYIYNQFGSGICSLCKSNGVNKSTCPLNPKNIEKGIPPDFKKHPLAREVMMQAPRPPAIDIPPDLGIISESRHKILVLQSPYDHNDAFDIDGDEGLFTIFRQLRDYDLIHKQITSMKDIEDVFSSLQMSKIAHVVIMCHGEEDRLIINYDLEIIIDSPEFYRLAELLREYLNPDASILLHSCCVGTGGPENDNFAQNLANVVPGHVVFGSENAIGRGELLVTLAETKENKRLEMNYEIDPEAGYTLHKFVDMSIQFSGGGMCNKLILVVRI